MSMFFRGSLISSRSTPGYSSSLHAVPNQPKGKHCSSPGCEGGKSRPSPAPVLVPFDPTDYTILETFECGPYTGLRIQYHNAPAFGGVKCLVYEATPAQLLKQKSLDPHFVEKKKYHCPIARFRGDANGWNYAKRWAEFAMKR